MRTVGDGISVYYFTTMFYDRCNDLARSFINSNVPMIIVIGSMVAYNCYLRLVSLAVFYGRNIFIMMKYYFDLVDVFKCLVDRVSGAPFCL